MCQLSEACAERHRARVAASDKEVAELKLQLARVLFVEATERQATRERLHADAERVWGPDTTGSLGSD